MTIFAKNFTNANVFSFLQVLLFAHLLSLYVSPVLANLFELILYTAVFFNSHFRAKFRDFVSSETGRAFFLFLLMLLFGYIVAKINGFLNFAEFASWRKFFLLPVALVLFSGDQTSIHQFSRLFIIGSSILTAILLFRHSLGHPFIFRNSSTQSTYLAVPLILAFFEFFRQKNWEKPLYGVCILILLFALFGVTSGRSGWLIFFISAIFFIIKFKGPSSHRAVLLAALIMTISMFFIYSELFRSRSVQAFTEFFSAVDSSTSTSIGLRRLFWIRTIEIIPHFFWFGSGTDTFESAYSLYHQWRAQFGEVLTRDPHNQFLKIIVENGFFGLLIFIYFLWILIKNASPTPYKIFGVSVVFAWIGSSFFNGHFTSFQEGRMILILMGVYLGFRTQPIKKS